MSSRRPGSRSALYFEFPDNSSSLFVKVQCICPSFADTAILGDQAHRDMLEKNYGILTVEEVSEGFMQLVENCGNGAAVIVFKVLFSLILSSSR